MKNQETVLGRKCVECGKILSKLHIGELCITCEKQTEHDHSDEEDFEKFTKQKKGWK